MPLLQTISATSSAAAFSSAPPAKIPCVQAMLIDRTLLPAEHRQQLAQGVQVVMHLGRVQGQREYPVRGAATDM